MKIRTGNARTIKRVMSMLVTAASILTLALPVTAQVLELDDGDMERLGIRFAEVKPVAQHDGFRVPATVTHSPDSRSRISSRTPAILKQWHATGGERVKAGQAVVTLTSSDLLQTQQQWLAAHQSLAKQQAQLTRDQQLFDDGIIARLRLEQTRRDTNQARFELQAWQQQLLQAGFTESELQQLYKGDLSPGEITLKSPQTGLLNRALVHTGDNVQAHQKLATVTNKEELWLQASIDIGLIEGLDVGTELSVLETDSRVILISKNLDLAEQTQTAELQARFTDPTSLHPGQQVTLLIGAEHSGWQVPATAVTHTDGRTYVYVRHSKGVEARELPLRPLGQGYLAASGLYAGELLVVQGSAQLKGIQLGLGGSD